VRGFCYATDATTGQIIPNPSNSQCNMLRTLFSGGQDNRPGLGGFVHSQAAIVPASPFITDAPVGAHRPTVAYVGGLDGMLHAFYVPSDGKDHSYTGPASAVKTLTAKDASTTFHKTVDASVLKDSNALKELWAFIPPGQLPLLQSNNAMVDSSPVVIDAYGDFDGSGVRTWHTVLVASAGGGNREVFALDVTNPLKPILLWDLQANYQNDVLQYAPTPLTDDDTGKNTATQAQAFAWQNGCHAGAANCTVTDFKLPPMGKPATTGLYNYSNLGASQSISVAQMRRFNSPVFAAFVATNEPQDKQDSGSGLFVFAIDVTTGQKIWEFNNPYNLSDDPAEQIAGIGNTPPAGVTLLSKAGNSLIDTAFVGDDEGALWELDAADGVNVNSFAPLLGSTSYSSLCSSKQRCNFALNLAYGDGVAHAQPISSLSTIFFLPTMPSTSPLKKYEGQPMLAFGTAGTDTVAALEPAPDATGNPCPAGSTAPCISGKVHLIPLLPNYRYTTQDLVGTNSSTVLNDIQTWGLLKHANEPAGIALTNGERVYGSIVAAGDQLFYNTTTGSVSSIDARNGNINGSTYRLLLSAGGALTPYNYVAAAGLTKAGGSGGTPMLDTTTGAVVVVTDKQILRFNPPAGGTLKGPSVNGKGATPTGLLSWFFRRRGLEY
jgi:type IV pilus assembly protein PilY1